MRRLFHNSGKRMTAVSIVASDGPTSVFLSGCCRRQERKRDRELKRMADRIRPGTHTIKEVERYLTNRLGARETQKDSQSYRSEYRKLKVQLIRKHRPDLIQTPVPHRLHKHSSPEKIRHYRAILHKREEEALLVPFRKFPVHLKQYKIMLCQEGKQMGCIQVDMEEQYDIFKVSYECRGNEKVAAKIMADLYLYYGVTENDIKTRSMQFRSLVCALENRNGKYDRMK